MADLNFNSILYQLLKIGNNIFGGLKERENFGDRFISSSCVQNICLKHIFLVLAIRRHQNIENQITSTQCFRSINELQALPLF